MNKKWSKEHFIFVKNSVINHTLEEVRQLFNEHFNLEVTLQEIKYLNYYVHKVKTETTNERVVQWLADFYYTIYPVMKNILKRNKINALYFKNLLEAEDLIHRRDEFYSLFKNENTADRLWILIWENGRREIC